MAIQGNSSEKAVVASGAKWTGICNMKVVMINPTMEEMKRVGMNPTKEPEYFTEREGKKSFRLDIYLNNAANKINAKAALFVEASPRKNKTGDNFQYINTFGQTGWSKDGGASVSNSYFKMEGVREAIVGEEVLTNFIKAWINVAPDSQAVLDAPMALADGNLSEIKSLLSAYPNNEVQVLLGVREVEGKHYQDVYTGYFDRPYRKAFDAWKKALEGEYGEFKSDYQNDFKLRTYEGGRVITDTPTNLDNASPAPGAMPYNF